MDEIVRPLRPFKCSINLEFFNKLAVLTFESIAKILLFENSNETSWQYFGLYCTQNVVFDLREENYGTLTEGFKLLEIITTVMM